MLLRLPVSRSKTVHCLRHYINSTYTVIGKRIGCTVQMDVVKASVLKHTPTKNPVYMVVL